VIFSWLVVTTVESRDRQRPPARRPACRAAAKRSTLLTPMLRRALRATLFAGLVLALWTFARPASAMPAALCDDRGASAIAPAPALEAPEDALRRPRFAPSCGDHDLPFFAAVSRAHPRLATPPPGGDKALPVLLVHSAATCAEVLEPPASEVSTSHGVRSRIDRPPRA